MLQVVRSTRGKLRRSQSVEDSSTILSQTSDVDDLLSEVDQNKADRIGRGSCKHCNGDINSMFGTDDHLDYITCDCCGESMHIFCMGYNSVF